MMTSVLIVSAAASLAWPWIKEHAAAANLSKLERHHYVALALCLAATLTYRSPQDDSAPPIPPPLAIDLRGTFVGPDASADASAVAAICDELANELEWDSKQAEPLFKTGVAFDELRVRARILRFKGESIGDKHPRARSAIEQYLNTAAGTSGGPLTPESRMRWIAAYREVARAAEAAAR